MTENKSLPSSELEESDLDPLRRRIFMNCAGYALLLWGVAFILHQDVVASLLSIWANDTSFNHGFLILPGFFYLCYRKRADILQTPPIFEPLGLFWIIAAGLVIRFGAIAGVNPLAQGGLILLLQGIAFTCLGRHVTKKLVFPLFFLFFAVPVGTEFIVPLQNFTAEASTALLSLSGVANNYEGVYITTANSRFYVAEACAGLRFLIANIVIACLFAHLTFRTRRSWLIFIPISIAIPVIGNVLRVFGIMTIAHYSHNQYGASVDHIVYGWGFFTVLMVINLYIGDVIARREEKIAEETAPITVKTGYENFETGLMPYRDTLAARRLLPALIVTLLLPVGVEKFIDIRRNAARTAPLPTCEALVSVAFPAGNDKDKAIEKITPFHNPDQSCAIRFPEQDVTVLIGYYAAQRPDKEIVHYKNRFHDEENKLLLDRFVTYSSEGEAFIAEFTGIAGGSRYLTLYRYCNGSGDNRVCDISAGRAKLSFMKNLLLRGDMRGTVEAFTRALPPGHYDEQDKEEAVETLLSVIKEATP